MELTKAQHKMGIPEQKVRRPLLVTGELLASRAGGRPRGRGTRGCPRARLRPRMAECPVPAWPIRASLPPPAPVPATGRGREKEKLAGPELLMMLMKTGRKASAAWKAGLAKRRERTRELRGISGKQVKLEREPASGEGYARMRWRPALMKERTRMEGAALMRRQGPCLIWMLRQISNLLFFRKRRMPAWPEIFLRRGALAGPALPLQPRWQLWIFLRIWLAGLWIWPGGPCIWPV